ncbi:hypothetical protein [Limnofasciculus baicalensis]|uniref:Uncharacterized protein n=1 Tax=Limnofasciculus baicalensis BBK-W-15 TaxID=2699891 RepID=A0AAE3GPW3_9CYAN|nr:hypothetical protein [Limnofasciculus baicalensis]MCP2728329.1 hypothetical protein [Limnofasciculus baicalensis BBK-W-15]
MTTSVSEDDKRRRIRQYFTKLKLKWPSILITIGLLILLAKSAIGLIILIAGGVWFFLEVKPLFDAPGDQTIDAWLIDDIENLKKRSLDRLNIDPSELIRDSIVIRGPILWNTNGVPSKELDWKKGKDGRIRFSINAVTIVHLTEHKLSSYQCDYNFLRNVPLNEQDDEFHYRDVVAVSTRDDTTNYTLPNNTLMKQAQLFKLAVSSGDSINVIVNSADLVKFTGGDIAETGIDNAIKALRKVLSEKKI